MQNGNWCVRGSYKDIVEDPDFVDEEAEWEFENGKYSLMMYLVSLNIILYSYLM